MREFQPLPAISAIALQTLLLWFGAVPCNASSTKNHIVVDLDAPAPFVYQQKVVAECVVGSSTGQIGVRPMEDWDIGPSAMTADMEGNLFIVDDWNQKVQRFNRSGKFTGVAFDIPAKHAVGSLAVDRKGHLFVSMGIPERMDTWRIVEVVNRKVLCSYPLPEGVETLGDGDVWISSGSLVEYYRPLPGRKPGEMSLYMDLSASAVWPWREGKTVRVDRISPVEFEVSIVRRDGKVEMTVRFKSAKKINGLGPDNATAEAIFLSGGFAGRGFRYELRPGGESRLIEGGTIAFPRKAPNAAMDAGPAADGSVFGLYVTPGTTRAYDCQIIRASPIAR